MITLIEEFKTECNEKELYSNRSHILGFAFGYSLHMDDRSPLHLPRHALPCFRLFYKLSLRQTSADDFRIFLPLLST